jgi:hypothetical protein
VSENPAFGTSQLEGGKAGRYSGGYSQPCIQVYFGVSSCSRNVVKFLAVVGVTPRFHAGNTGSNPVGDVKAIRQLMGASKSGFFRRTDRMTKGLKTT